ncbi:MAG: DUF6288 domain-containing protein [Lentisphaeria bacterium]|nr:DUF6288 domain-containing protein [Lentisphaeria bacterium]
MKHLKAIALIIVAALAAPNVQAGKNPQPIEPDYTKGETLNDPLMTKYSALGPIGAIGNIWVEPKGPGTATMIQIRSVEAGSPADGLLQRCDVILGIGDGKFTADARKELSAAIIEAEKNENGGKLVLNVWHPETEMAPVVFPYDWQRRMAIEKGEPLEALTVKMPIQAEIKQVTIMLPVMGAFSETAPWECEKTQALIDAAAKSIIDNDLFIPAEHKVAPGERYWAEIPELRKDGHGAWLGALGLLATGEEKYLPIVQKYVRAMGDPKVDLDWRNSGQASWFWSYQLILLSEYYLATGDDYVLPAIKEYATEMTKGASPVGTFSHGMAYSYEVNGVEVKYPSAYGAMNQCSITCIMSLVMARECGVSDPEVDKVIESGLKFYRWYVDKGAIPYGDHEPWMGHDNNGVNSQVAVLFDIVGDKEATEYFTRTTLASYKIREQGHTGHFFSWQWGALGAARGGEKAAQSFVRNTRWYTELERRFDGRSIYQPQLSGDHGKYLDWSTTGSRLLQHCLPRRKLYITGKGGSCIEPITGKELEETVAAAEFDAGQLTTPQLLAALGSWSPVVRQRAAEGLGQRDNDDVVKELIAMLDGSNRYARYGAAIGLRYAGRGSEEAVDKMINLLQESDDMTLRFTICTAMRQFRPRQEPRIGLGKAVLKAGPALLKQITIYEPEKDPMRKLHAVLSGTLFYGGNAQGYWGHYPNGKGAESIDSDLKVAVIKSFLRNPNGGARSNASSLYKSLTAAELEKVWGDIYCAAKYQAPSGSMGAAWVRASGLELMVEKGVKEGIPVGIDWALRQEGWGNGGRKRLGIPLLLKYGKALESYLSEIGTVLAGWTKEKNSKNDQKGADDFKAKLAEALKEPAPKLISIKPYIETVDPKEFYTTELKK